MFFILFSVRLLSVLTMITITSLAVLEWISGRLLQRLNYSNISITWTLYVAPRVVVQDNCRLRMIGVKLDWLIMVCRYWWRI